FAGVPVALALGGGLLTGLTRRTVRTAAALAVMAAVVILGLGASSWSLTRTWRDAGTLWARAVAVDPNSYQAHTNLGLYELSRNRYDAAVSEFDAAIALNPRSSNARFDRGLALAKWGRTADAIASYQAGLALDPVDATAHAHLGDLFASIARWADAEAEYRAAARLVPHPDLYNSLGVALAQQDRFAEAVAAFRDALAMDPSHADAKANLDMALQIRPTR
ncbi:MAG TPA: tetratricopeptide repeat protein, partial [Nitrospiria bacterium]|nr:tetratricopeptide repeat protein [Nitrospiria bacterium]